MPQGGVGSARGAELQGCDQGAQLGAQGGALGWSLPYTRKSSVDGSVSTDPHAPGPLAEISLETTEEEVPRPSLVTPEERR